MPGELVLFYSRADENYVDGMLKNLKIGNTEIAAGHIEKMTGAVLFKVEQQEAYSKDYQRCIAQARADQRQNVRPELKSYPQSIEEYDVVYLGYPNYWGTMPMAMFTLLEHFDFDGKIIRPFCTHEGSGMGSSVEDIKKLCPKAIVEKGLALRGSDRSNYEEQIRSWIKKEER